MKAIALIVLVACTTAFADPPAPASDPCLDAVYMGRSPASCQHVVPPVVKVERAVINAEDGARLTVLGGRYLTDEKYIATAQRIVEAETKVAEYEKNPGLPAWAVLAIGVAAALTGVAIGAKLEHDRLTGKPAP
jgi:hypothetical protein